MKKITILHPSWKRSKLALQCYNEWLNKAANKNTIEYILCLSVKDPTINLYLNTFANSAAKILLLEDNGLIRQVNHAAQHAVGNLFVAVSDDFGCPEKWDEHLLAALEGKKDYMIKTQDGLQPWIITLPIMDRVYYEQKGYIYHPQTYHMFCDNWITHEAHLLGKVISLPLLFPHRHYSTGAMLKDEVNWINDSTWALGEKVYLEGVKNNFGIKTPLPLQLPGDYILWLRSKGIEV